MKFTNLLTLLGIWAAFSGLAGAEICLAENGKTPGCDLGKVGDFISLFQDQEAGDFIFVRIEQDGLAQYVNNIRYWPAIKALKSGKITPAAVNNLFAKLEAMNFWRLQNHYGQADPNIAYEYKEENRITAAYRGRCKRVIFHGSNKEFDPLIDLILQSISSLPDSNLSGTFINATDQFLRRSDLPVHTLTLGERSNMPEIFEAIHKPESFIFIPPDRESFIRSLAKGGREFYVKYQNNEYIIRIFRKG